jgi:cell wall-associated NlpC family hydrolase
MAWFQKPIALTPAGGGGVCISQDALQPADIIVSTTRQGVSAVIRVGTLSSVSHAALYAGNGWVIEAIGEGVVRRTLDVALADDALAVAYRSPAMAPEIAALIVEYAAAQLGKPYSIAGAVLSADKEDCLTVAVFGPKPASFFCSQLVFEAYRQGGLPLTTLPSQCVTPADAAVIARHQLTYVGHLLGDPSWFPMVSP